MSKNERNSDLRRGSPVDFGYIERLREEIHPNDINLLSGIRVKRIITESIKKSHLSRIQVADRMSKFLGIEITLAKLDAWCAESKHNHRFPLEFLPAFVKAIENWDLVIELCRMVGGNFVKGEGLLYTELGKLEEMDRWLKDRKVEIRKLLTEERE